SDWLKNVKSARTEEIIDGTYKSAKKTVANPTFILIILKLYMIAAGKILIPARAGSKILTIIH
ncbi:MAG: hypothetical protein ACYSR9_11885, partial [Planctomycetota bacterium]